MYLDYSNRYCNFIGLDYLSHRKSGKEYQERIDSIKDWKKPNLNYFKAFDCSPSLDETRNTKILKFFVFYTDKDANCDIEEIQKPTITFKNLNILDYEFNLIKDSNVLIWIKKIEGESEGTYTDGSYAIRLNAEINFINKNSNVIYKQVILKCVGEPTEKFKKSKYSKSQDLYFGSLPLDEISNLIEKKW
ncbi:hypothetical protein QGN23_00545 [Chryseobacterium gotjawalense]|uniref:Uncharacterized protein n=1 Tax=Chryseobacterium gotjawalense TaxID=3042315 RepID=A0ABY8RCR9_9FLAO|nr:hypothetical protein [Chryseobacterium sp. wdc7]WHF51782.1 hypothetical protein QGN23_00545 [Chryseobacterium sp. wdc7]